MIRIVAAGLLLLGVAPATAAPPTDFGIRSAAPASRAIVVIPPTVRATSSGAVSTSLASAAAIASRWGRVTSTYRTRERNRLVGGVPNSYHLSGRAIDVVRRPGVRHADIAAALSNAGYRLVESLDEGDHSHFAFSFGGGSAPLSQAAASVGTVPPSWKVVYAPGARR